MPLGKQTNRWAGSQVQPTRFVRNAVFLYWQLEMTQNVKRSGAAGTELEQIMSIVNLTEMGMQHVFYKKQR